MSKTPLLLFLLTYFGFGYSQLPSLPTIVSGNIQTIGQYYQEDTLINAALPDQLLGFNGFANVNVQREVLTTNRRLRLQYILLFQCEETPNANRTIHTGAY